MKKKGPHVFIWSNRNIVLLLLYLKTIPYNSLTQADQSFKCSIQMRLILFPHNLNSGLPSSIQGRPISNSRKRINLLFIDISQAPRDDQPGIRVTVAAVWHISDKTYILVINYLELFLPECLISALSCAKLPSELTCIGLMASIDGID